MLQRKAPQRCLSLRTSKGISKAPEKKGVQMTNIISWHFMSYSLVYLFEEPLQLSFEMIRVPCPKTTESIPVFRVPSSFLKWFQRCVSRLAHIYDLGGDEAILGEPVVMPSVNI